MCVLTEGHICIRVLSIVFYPPLRRWTIPLTAVTCLSAGEEAHGGVKTPTKVLVTLAEARFYLYLFSSERHTAQQWQIELLALKCQAGWHWLFLLNVDEFDKSKHKFNTSAASRDGQRPRWLPDMITEEITRPLGWLHWLFFHCVFDFFRPRPCKTSINAVQFPSGPYQWVMRLYKNGVLLCTDSQWGWGVSD